MKKKIILLLTVIAALFTAIPVFAGNTYLNGFEGEYFNSISDDPRTWFGYRLNIYSMTDTEMSFDFQYDKPGHAVALTAEKASFTDTYNATAKGTSGYADQPESAFPITYNFSFTNNHILLKIYNSYSGEEIYNLDFYSASGVISKGITVLVNNKEVHFDQKPIIAEDRTLVPLRAIMEALGADVSWNGETKTAISKKGDITVKLSIGSNTMYVNDNAVKIDAPARIVNDFTLVPVRAISEAYNTIVDWDNDTKTVSIKTAENADGFGKYEDNVFSEEQSKMNIEQAKQLLSEGFDEVYRPDLVFNIISEDNDYYHIRVLWHNIVTGNNNLWGDYRVDKKNGAIVGE